MKLESISDIDKLPSVLDVDEVSARLIELINVLRQNKLDCLEGAEAINHLISYQGYDTKEIGPEASVEVIEWTAENYDEKNMELTECSIANVVNMRRTNAIEFLKDRYVKSNSAFEKNEIKEALNEIGEKT